MILLLGINLSFFEAKSRCATVSGLVERVRVLVDCESIECNISD